MAVALFDRALPLRERQRQALIRLLKEDDAVARNPDFDELQLIQFLLKRTDAELSLIFNEQQKKRFNLLVKQIEAEG